MTGRRLPCRPIARAMVAALSLLMVLALGAHAHAQFTGGSVGGGDFSGGGGGGGGSSDHDGGGDVFALLEIILFLFRVNPVLGFAGLFVLLLYVVWRSRRAVQGGGSDDSVRSPVPGPGSRRWRSVDITEVRVAIDARARAFLQRELMAQGRRANVSTPRGRLELLHVVVRAIRQAEAAWVYAGAKNFHPMSSILAETTFKRLAGDARAKFTHELVRRDEQGTREGEGHGVVRSREREGEGVVLITLIVAAGREIVDFQATHREEVLKVLADLDALTPDTIVAIEVSWLPAHEDDLMSTATLEALHPDMKRLPGVVGGRVFCGFCRGPHAAELSRCPHCGAPTDAAPTGASP